ncbi:MAG TPA: hypothetical protein VK154_11630 [Chitinophagales bacterium]|nr:hypothetical protein [Chitinophagales bacterium]
MFANSFDTEERSFKTRKTSIAGFVTIAVHALILLFLIFQILTPPDPPYTDSAGGVTVNFGTDATGSGDEQPMTLTPIQADFAPAASAPASQPAANEEELATQDLEEAPVMESTKSDKPKPKTEKPVTKPNTNVTPNTANKPTKNETPAPVEPKPDDNAMFKKGGRGTPNNSKGDGTGGPQGDQGDPNGDVNSRDYTKGNGGTGGGPGSGTGGRGGVNLKGRKSASLPAPRFCDAKGNVIIDITVDRNGNVVDAKYHRDGSTITDNCSIENAKKAAKLSKFNAEPNADEYQYGSINYVFTVQ